MRRIVLVSVPALVGLLYLAFAFAVITGTMRRKEGDDPPIDPFWEQAGHWLVRNPLGYFVDNILILPFVHAAMWTGLVYVLFRLLWRK